MPKVKGSPKTGGRVAGKPNKVTTEFREAINCLLRNNSENVSKWLELVAEGNPAAEVKPDPYKALDMLSKLAEYAMPKLARQEVVGDAEAPVKYVIAWEK